ncbi:MAG: DUF1952 domain-containing protein [Candidatus Promineofilum sp.]|nr:DUF1952 domain-containing protein [Promineifilum sp.]
MAWTVFCGVNPARVGNTSVSKPATDVEGDEARRAWASMAVTTSVPTISRSS